MVRGVVLLLALCLLAGCEQPREPTMKQVIRVWAHQGQESENRALRAIAQAFNAAQPEVEVDLTFFPDFQYMEKLAIAAAAGDLPDVFDLDGPLVARFVDSGLLLPLDRFFSAGELDDFLPTIRRQGTVDGVLYALGAFESGIVLYYDREMLARAGVTLPAEAGAASGWSWEEFMRACQQLKQAGFMPLSLHMDESADEWYTYAFSPVIWSGGGELISTEAGRTSGVLASAQNVESLRLWQEIFTSGFADTSPLDPDPFGSGKVAMDWTGHWMARSHLERKGEALGVMPLPRLRSAASTACGSWCWAISAQTEKTDNAVKWLKWVTDAREGVEPMVRANGAIPARRSAFAAFPEYRQLPYALFREQLETIARPRPRTPHYSSLTRAFAAALRDIATGADVASRLQRAEEEVNRVIRRRAVSRAGVTGKEESR